MNENICKIEAKGFQDLCNHIRDLEEKNKTLEKTNRILSDELTYFKEYSADLEEDVHSLKERCRTLSSENLKLSSEISEMRFTRKYLTSEEAGRQFAEELLNPSPFVKAEISAEKMESEIVGAMGSYMGDDY